MTAMTVAKGIRSRPFIFTPVALKRLATVTDSVFGLTTVRGQERSKQHAHDDKRTGRQLQLWNGGRLLLDYSNAARHGWAGGEGAGVLGMIAQTIQSE
jgi:hypothetical protein